MKKGKLIVFEGPDGVGKTVLSKYVRDMLSDSDLPCSWMSFPGREEGTLGHLIYDIHHQAQHFGIRNLTPASKQALHIASHLDTIENRIKPLLSAGTHVVLDRFWWSTYVYGINDAVSVALLENLIGAERICWSGYSPDLIILIEADSPRDRDEEREAWASLKDSYKALALTEMQTSPVYMLDNNASLDAAKDKIAARVKNIVRT